MKYTFSSIPDHTPYTTRHDWFNAWLKHDKLIDDGMSIEEAEEFFEYNQLGAWVGETTPVFITLNPKETLPCPENSTPNKK